MLSIVNIILHIHHMFTYKTEIYYTTFVNKTIKHVQIKTNTLLLVDNQCHDFDLDCLGKAGRELIGDGAQLAGG